MFCTWSNNTVSSRKIPSSRKLRRVSLVRTDDSKERIASTFRVIRIGELGPTLAVTTRVFRPDSPTTRSRRSNGSGGESASMLKSMEGNAVQAFSKGNNF
jgi:hypothetical protein